MTAPIPPNHQVSHLTPKSHEAHQAEILSTADTMSSDELDRLPYGMIQLDAAGRIMKYNAVESRLAQLSQTATIGKKFFSEVAPCTKVQQFYGQFKEGVLRESLDSTFSFHFAFKQHPRDVTVRLFYSKRTRSVWVMVSDREGNPIE
jgi:photoactive yellow protein